MHATKLIVRDVRDVSAVERFYRAVGLALVSRNLGGEQEVRQQQSWLSAGGDATTQLLILN